MTLMLIGFALIALIDLTPIVRRRSLRDGAVFLVLFASALTLGVLEVRGAEVPSMLLLLGNMLKALGLSY